MSPVSHVCHCSQGASKLTKEDIERVFALYDRVSPRPATRPAPPGAPGHTLAHAIAISWFNNLGAFYTFLWFCYCMHMNFHIPIFPYKSILNIINTLVPLWVRAALWWVSFPSWHISSLFAITVKWCITLSHTYIPAAIVFIFSLAWSFFSTCPCRLFSPRNLSCGSVSCSFLFRNASAASYIC